MDRAPGELGEFGAFAKPVDAQEWEKVQVAELKHGRLAMLAVVGALMQEALTGEGPVEQLLKGHVSGSPRCFPPPGYCSAQRLACLRGITDSRQCCLVGSPGRRWCRTKGWAGRIAYDLYMQPREAPQLILGCNLMRNGKIGPRKVVPGVSLSCVLTSGARLSCL